VRDLTTPAPRRRRTGERKTGGFYEDVDERALIEAEQNHTYMPPEYQYLKPGCFVHHPKFGRGRVLEVRGKFPKTRIDINFDQWGQKTLVLSKTSLELLEN